MTMIFCIVLDITFMEIISCGLSQSGRDEFGNRAIFGLNIDQQIQAVQCNTTDRQILNLIMRS